MQRAETAEGRGRGRERIVWGRRGEGGAGLVSRAGVARGCGRQVLRRIDYWRKLGEVEEQARRLSSGGVDEKHAARRRRAASFYLSLSPPSASLPPLPTTPATTARPPPTLALAQSPPLLPQHPNGPPLLPLPNPHFRRRSPRLDRALQS